MMKRSQSSYLSVVYWIKQIVSYWYLLLKVHIYAKNNFRIISTMGLSLSACITKKRFRLSIIASAPGSYTIIQVFSLNTYLVRINQYQLHFPPLAVPYPSQVWSQFREASQYFSTLNKIVTTKQLSHPKKMSIENKDDNELCVSCFKHTDQCK